jgi:hypothetical protein
MDVVTQSDPKLSNTRKSKDVFKPPQLQRKKTVDKYFAFG